jgi:hypothetical protein
MKDQTKSPSKSESKSPAKIQHMVGVDVETDIPLSLIDEAEFNPKSEIGEVYKRGLVGSLQYFTNRDRLKVWPDPDKKGRFVTLNGNKRLRIFMQQALDEADIKIREYFKLEPSEDITSLKSNPKHGKIISKITRECIAAERIPCQIMNTIDGVNPFTKADAIQFVSTYDRNMAKFDEIKQADNYRQLIQERISDDSTRKSVESRIKTMMRPELPINTPKTSQSNGSSDQSAFTFAAPGEFTPTSEEPWGPTPPATQVVTTAQPVTQLVPMVFSLTPEGYVKITESILRSKARLFREFTLKDKLETLERLTEGDIDGHIDSIVVETALSIVNHHIKVEESKHE